MDVVLADTVALTDDGLAIIDQTLLPDELKIIHLRSLPEIWEAINSLRVRGAPAIGIAAALGVYVAAKNMHASAPDEFKEELIKAVKFLNSARPTAVNLSWALGQMQKCVEDNPKASVPELIELLGTKAKALLAEDIAVCEAIGRHGLSLLHPNDALLTHCNAGRLAAIKYGTATAPMYLGQRAGYNFKIYCDETRPLLQGARLTAWELSAAGMDVTLVCDGMAASLMQQGKINAILVGCDRVAANGDTANKIGTLPLAIAASYYKAPIYFCAPTSSIDMNTPSGAQIEIEQRPGQEITSYYYAKPMAPADVAVYNPAFDVTSHELISAFITEYGVLYPPFGDSLARVMKKKEQGEKF